MKHVILPFTEQRRLTFYLALEEYLAQTTKEDLFFLWQVGPTVIFGRNQVMENEVNVPYCAEHGIDLVRRKSGGGCVYSDEGNIMLSYVTPGTNVDEIFGKYLDNITEALRALGFDAARTTHNDVLVGDRKVSGNAFFSLAHSSIVHGTMLYDTDFSALERAITPSEEKLSKHGVKSVRQRVANLRALGLEMDLESFKNYLISHFCDDDLALGDEAIHEVEEIEKSYLDPSFLAGRH